MQSPNEIEKRIVDLQTHYQLTLLGSKEFSELKAIKNNLKKLYRELNLQNKEKLA